VILVFAQCAGKTIALLVPGDAEGLSVRPLKGLLGFRASMMAELIIDGVFVPHEGVVGRAGFGVSHVALAALDLGRYAIARGSVGLAAMCLEVSVEYATHRIQFGVPLSSHQLIQRMLADMATQVSAARALCLEAASLRESGSPDSIIETSKAKYFASQTAVNAANHALQIQGAHGCGPDSPVQRYYRDAKITEIIEGSSQMQQIMIAQDLVRKQQRRAHANA
jgi:glutaryl-CoA dehydrogenase (non-decarboxylating)